MIYHFTITIDQLIDDLDAIDEFAGRASDNNMSHQGDTTWIRFHREARSLDEAIRSAARDIEASGWEIAEISVETSFLKAS
jgi:hypothetical protein